jgi:hypothetical protein
MATFFVFVPIPQFLGYPPTSSVWDLTINAAIGISDGRSLKPLIQWLPNLNFALSGIHGLHTLLIPVNLWANCAISMSRLDQTL